MMLHLFETNRIQKNKRMKKYRCTVCEWIYDPAVGDPDGGIAAGTAFEDIPEDWVCPRRLGGRYDIDDEYPERFGNIAEFS